MQSFRSSSGTVHFRASTVREGRKTLVFINSLGTDLRIWDGVVEVLADQFNVMRYDKRGHGLSDGSSGPVKISDYTEDIRELLQHLKVGKVIPVGLSVGGLIAQALYKSQPDMIEALILSNTAVRIGTVESWNSRIASVRAKGMVSILDAVMERWFSPDFRTQRKGEFALYRNMLERADVNGYVSCCEAIRDADYTADAAKIAVPALCIVGDHDGATPPDLVKATASLIPRSQMEVIPGAAHLPCVEKPETYAGILVRFIAERVSA